MRFVLAIGSTHTATIDGISAAGASADLLFHTPAADAEIVEYGRPVRAPVTPVSPSGCPTPAVITRSVRELIDFDVLVIEAGLAVSTAAPTIQMANEPGEDIRECVSVPAATEVFERARDLGGRLPDEELIIGESIPGGTTTALGVLSALGEPFGVSSSMKENPLALKREVVAVGVKASGLAYGAASDAPLEALRTMGDPVLTAVAGVVVGALDAEKRVILAGGTQMLTAAATVRHFGVCDPLELATTAYIAREGDVDIKGVSDDLDIALSVTDPKFEQETHEELRAYDDGEAKEGVGMGGALFVAEREGVPMSHVRDQTISCYERLVNDNG